ncbi:MAG TPA: DUF3460 family protein [Zoogloea sp.]|uniref:DUF3460 family protein n=1 Tax=Zoogloea sp. TaxID=49181 RepID=UPI002CDEA2E7|nr:DUF3460 family protein [Zoogloea sp.]HMV16575.1 DUF3460 family protein [Rhodocyclaceae bacterium]HMV62016.1 DUF3460 family protein [Rhodocyclaceae bacterium]HMW51189.1 DUF3460 family protein [Rhodocyclaceae bacterium]HMY48725.1 DUF3460 family protein [Rhodocyclaceae bacterium]HMZ76830.1 DUF3460 family protein [Rhodocyclaceae bacterium]
MAIYESEHTQFMREWLKNHPEEVSVQQAGRALWWDRPQNPELNEGFAVGKIEQKPYPYSTEG